MSASERIAELLLRWEDARRQGVELTPEELCREGPGIDSPQLASELRQRIGAIRSMEQRLDMAFPDLTPTLDIGPPGPGDGRPVAATTASDQPNPLRNAVLASPVSIPGYAIAEIIDQGGMGIVYRAVQTSLQRTVAIKMMTAPSS